jgi:hypothetical protein
MARTNLSNVTNNFTHILVALDANDADFVHMAGERQELGTLLPEIIELNATQAALNARSQQTTKDLNEKVDRGLLLFTRLRSAVKAKYGTRSEKLTEFRLRPLTRRRAAPAKVKKETPAAPASTPAPTTPALQD